MEEFEWDRANDNVCEEGLEKSRCKEVTSKSR